MPKNARAFGSFFNGLTDYFREMYRDKNNPQSKAVIQLGRSTCAVSRVCDLADVFGLSTYDIDSYTIGQRRQYFLSFGRGDNARCFVGISFDTRFVFAELADLSIDSEAGTASFFIYSMVELTHRSNTQRQHFSVKGSISSRLLEGLSNEDKIQDIAFLTKDGRPRLLLNLQYNNYFTYMKLIDSPDGQISCEDIGNYGPYNAGEPFIITNKMFDLVNYTNAEADTTESYNSEYSQEPLGITGSSQKPLGITGSSQKPLGSTTGIFSTAGLFLVPILALSVAGLMVLYYAISRIMGRNLERNDRSEVGLEMGTLHNTTQLEETTPMRNNEEGDRSMPQSLSTTYATSTRTGWNSHA